MADEAAVQEQQTTTADIEQAAQQPAADAQQQPQGEQAAQPETGGEQAAANQWPGAELPADHWARQSGAKTWGDVDNMYRSSSREARERSAELDRVRDQYAQALLEATTQQWRQGKPAQQPQQGQQPGPANDWWGYGSQEAWAAAYKANPQAAFNKMVETALTNNPALQQHVQGLAGQVVQPVQQQIAQAARQSEAAELFRQNPDFAPGTPVHNAIIERSRQAWSWLGPVFDRLPLEFVWKGLHYDILRQQNRATEGRMTTVRAASASARVGAGGKSAPSGSVEAQLRQAAEETFKSTGQPVPEEEIQRALESYRRLGLPGA